MSPNPVPQASTGIYETFGARVDFQDGPPGLFLVVPRAGDPGRLIAAHGGVVALRLNGKGGAVVARMTLSRALALQRDPGIRIVGGIHMNMERYRALLASIGAVGIADVNHGRDAAGPTS